MSEALAEAITTRVAAQLKRLPDGTFAPKGRGQVLKPGMHVHLPGDGGKYKVQAVGSVGVDGTSLGTNQIQVAKDGKDPKTISLEPGSAVLHDAVPQSQRYREFSASQTPEPPKSPGTGGGKTDDIASALEQSVAAAKKGELPSQKKQGAKKGKKSSAKQPTDEELKAKRAEKLAKAQGKEPPKSSSSTLAQTLTGKDAEAHGFDQVHVSKNNGPKGEAFKGEGYTAKGYGGQHGTAKGEGDTPEAAIEDAKAKAGGSSEEEGVAGTQPKAAAFGAMASGDTLDYPGGTKVVKAGDSWVVAKDGAPTTIANSPEEAESAANDLEGAAGDAPDESSASAPQAAPPAMPAAGGGLQKNTEGLNIGSMTPGTVFEMNDGTQFKYHKPVNEPFHIVKPLDGGKAKPLHEKYEPPMVGPLGGDEGSGAVPGTPEAPPARSADEGDLYDTLKASVDQQNADIDTMHSAGYKSKEGPAPLSATNNLATSPGRGPSGKMRNFKAMNPVKLKGVVAELEQHAGDPEALMAAKAALANKTT